MIRLNLGSEPGILTSTRNTHLSDAITSFNIGGAVWDHKRNHLSGYPCVRKTLWDRQHHKCAWCETVEDTEHRPVEHIRPKARADDRDGHGTWIGVQTHYWWLAWTWENLVFSCIQCNKNGHKGNRFPIRAGSSRIPAPVNPIPAPIPPTLTPLPNSFFDVSSEQALLIDPRRTDPLDHLRWQPVDRRKPRNQWQWTVVGLSEIGTMTIEVLRIDKRLDRVANHLNVAVTPMWGQIEQHIRATRIADARNAWDDLVTAVVETPERPYRAAAWWALVTLCPHSDRMLHGFRDPPRPSVHYP